MERVHRRDAEDAEITQRVYYSSAPPLRPLRLCGELIRELKRLSVSCFINGVYVSADVLVFSPGLSEQA